MNALPPFAHPLPHYTKVTSDDNDDAPNPEHHAAPMHDHDHMHMH